MKGQPRKSVGEIGVTKITVEEGVTSAEIVPSNLPTNKEALEAKFAGQFVSAFNAQRPLGQDIAIDDHSQKDTSDLDFTIKCKSADYLELAELNPRSAKFGQAMFQTGKFNVYEYARWMYKHIVQKKQTHYGKVTSGRTFLLLYMTHWQFLPTQNTLMCLRAFCASSGCDFASVFVLMTDGSDLQVIEHISPGRLDPPRRPRDFDGAAANLPPGQFQWKVDLSDVPPTVG